MAAEQSPINHDEADALIELYEFPNGTCNTYTLALKLHPSAKAGTPKAHEAFLQTREATEQLISRGLVQGERARGVDGVYFNALKLTTRGEQLAIRERTYAAKSEQEQKRANGMQELINELATERHKS
ncbi:MAG: hypothetical protein WBG54_08045 [Acidobacteriaceae bacterium]